VINEADLRAMSPGERRQLARRLIRLSSLIAMGDSGTEDHLPPLWKIPLLGAQAATLGVQPATRE
jgi:hypothetical protein